MIVAQNQQGMSLSRMVTIFVFILAVFILFDPSLRSGLGAAVGFVLEPIVGINGEYPVVTLFLTGMIMTGTTILMRHLFTDHVEQIKSQKIVQAFNKELRQARMENNTYKIKKLTDQQQEIMQKSMQVSTSQLKLLPISMIVVIPIFAWISVFMGQVENAQFAVPWAQNVDLNDNIVLPVWILLYSTISLPFGQILMRALRYYDFGKRLHEIEQGRSPEERPTLVKTLKGLLGIRDSRAAETSDEESEER
ncbi:MAG: DUF106 domain-containing protein [Methanomassiliicoccales archaeon]